MASSRTEDVFKLIKAMSKAEKRAFRLYAGRIQGKEQLLYMQLFDLMDKQKSLDEKALKARMPQLNDSRFSNLKRHLYTQILISLRLLQKEKNANIKIREYIDFAFALYGKGLYMQSLGMLEKAKKIATRHHSDFSLLTIVEVEKMIHSRHITRSKSEPINQLIAEASELSDTVSSRIKLSNLRILLHKFYVEQGHVKNEEDARSVRGHFQENLPEIEEEQLGMMERVFLYQSYVWYHYIQNDFLQCRNYALKWVSLFKQSEELRKRDINLFLRGYHYLLTSSYNIRDVENYQGYLDELEILRKTNYPTFNRNTQIVSFLYVHTGRMNLHFLQGTFEEGVERIKSTLRRIRKYRTQLDDHKIMVLYFKIAWMYIGKGDAEQAVDYLRHIIDMRNRALREDIQSYARLMFLMAHYDLGNFLILPGLITQYNRYFEKVSEKNKVQNSILALFRELVNAPVLDRRDILRKYYDQLKEVYQDPYEKRSFLYLDILPWLKARIERKPLNKVIQASR
jgi:hypothetical protein